LGRSVNDSSSPGLNYGWTTEFMEPEMVQFFVEELSVRLSPAFIV
jgi:hypothetical protein